MALLTDIGNWAQKTFSPQQFKQKAQPSFLDRVNQIVNTKFMPGQQMTLAQGFNKATQNFSTDFGNVLRGTGGIQGQQLKNPIIPKIPIISNAAKLSANTFQTATSGLGDIARGGRNVVSGIQQRNPLQVGQGAVNTLFGGAKVATSLMPWSPAGKVFQAGNVLSQSGGDLTQRLGKGIIQGQTGITTLAPNVKEKNINILGAKFDPIVGAGSLVGFTQNPAWAKIFGKTTKLAQYGLKGLALKGGFEGLIQGLDQLPDNPSQKDITNILLTNIAFGTGAEVGTKAVSDVFKKINGTKLAQSIKEDISNRFTSKMVDTVSGPMPFWKKELKILLGQTEDIFGTRQDATQMAQSSIELPSQKIKVVNGKIKVTPNTPQLEQPKIETDSYITEQIKRQEADARSGPQGGVEELIARQKVNKLAGKAVGGNNKKWSPYSTTETPYGTQRVIDPTKTTTTTINNIGEVKVGDHIDLTKQAMGGEIKIEGKVLNIEERTSSFGTKSRTIEVQKPDGEIITKNIGLNEKIDAYKLEPRVKSQPSTQQVELPAQKIKVVNGKIKVTPNTPQLTQPKIETDSYIADQLKKQQQDARSGPQGIMAKIKGGVADFKRKWVEAYSPLIDPVNEYARKNKAEILPTKNIDDQISRVLASDTIAARWLKDNGFEGVVGKDRDLLGQYLIARDNVTGMSRQGKLTGRDFNKDMQFVQSNPQFEERANQVTAMYKQLAQMAEDNGLLPKGTVEKLVAQNPNYVRWERIFNPDEKSVMQGSGKAVASLSKQSVVQSMKGSERAIENPLVSVINRAYKTFNEVERNKAADILTTYRNIPGNPYGLRKLGPKENVGTKSTISVIKNGVKEIWEVEKEVAEAAKNLNKEQMSTWLKVITAPVRLFKAGTTTLRIPFIATNIAKDQLTAFINSERAASTSLMNPKNALESLWESVGHGETFKKLERSGSMGTSFDIYREQPRITLEEIAAKKELGSRILYKITHPEQLLRSYENIVSRGEEFTRIQQFKGTYDALIKEGRTVEDATILAARAARQNTVDFNRFGELSRVLNWVIPYFNAGIQGSRSFLRSAQRNPVGTGAKMVAAVFTPMVASTIWNMATPDRREAYNDIQDYEKENNFIIIPPNPQKDAQGRWNVIKIPLSQEVANLANVSRLYTLQAVDGDRVAAGDVAADLIGATTSLDIKNPVNQFMPQPLKPGLEVVTNKNLYTGKDIVPSYMKGKPKEEQVYKFTSGTARALGKATNLSPLQAQHLVKGYLGSTGTDIMGQIDRTLADKGIIPKEQAGGMDIVDATTARFTKASGGKIIQDAKESADKGWSPRLLTAYDYLHSSKTLDENGLPAKNRNESMAFAQIRLANPQILAREAQEARLKNKMEGDLINPLYELPFDKQRVVLTLASLPPGQDKSDLQKANIDWLKQYWAENSVFFNKLKASGVQITDTQRGPVASAYVQAQMDVQNWKDPQVRAYLDANLAYKNKVREELGLTPLASGGGFSKFGAYTKKPKKVSFKKIKIKKPSISNIKVKKLPKLKLAKQPKIKAIKVKKIKSLLTSKGKGPTIKIKA